MRQKSELEIWLDKYYDEFDENYPLNIVGVKSSEDVIAEIKDCIKAGKKAEKETYKQDVVY